MSEQSFAEVSVNINRNTELFRHTHRHLAVLVAIASIGDPSMLELQRIVGRSRRAIQDIIRGLRDSNVVIQSNQASRRFTFRLINEGPYSLKGSFRLMEQKHPGVMDEILTIKAEHDNRQHD